MTLLGIIYTFILGLIVGSFLNVAALRYNTGRSIKGRSSCYTCRHKLEWFELVPLFSFILLRGKCRSCKSKISWQYPLIEFLVGVIFASLFVKFQFLLSFGLYAQFCLEYIYYAVIFSVLTIILVYDWKHKIIPDGLVYTFGLLSVLHMYPFTTISPWNLLAGPILFLPFYLLWKVSDGKWIGFGDGKLALGIGWMLGLVDGVTAVVLAFWSGAIVALVLLFLSHQKITMKSEIPFAPFLILGLTLIFFFGWDLLGLKALLSVLY